MPTHSPSSGVVEYQGKVRSMCRIKVERVEAGLIPSERVVQIKTTDGDEELVVSSGQVQEDTRTLTAALVGKDERRKTMLVELPRECASGRRRVWISNAMVVG